MFDNITCRVPLPLPEDLQELTDTKWSEVQFQTKSLYNSLLDYTIGPKGQLWRHDTTYKQVPVSDTVGCCGNFPPVARKAVKTTKVHDTYTGTINMYNNFRKEDADYWIEFSVNMDRGTLKNIELVDFSYKNNSARKATEQKLFAEITKQRNRQGRMWYKVYKIVYAAPIRFGFKISRNVANWISSNLWIVEKWLLPF